MSDLLSPYLYLDVKRLVTGFGEEAADRHTARSGVRGPNRDSSFYHMALSHYGRVGNENHTLNAILALITMRQHSRINGASRHKHHRAV